MALPSGGEVYFFCFIDLLVLVQNDFNVAMLVTVLE